MKSCWRAIGLITWAAALGACHAQEFQASEYQLKAAFLYHFAQFTEWPDKAFEKPSSPLVIGVLGDNPFGQLLEQTLRGKTLLQRPVVYRTIRSLDEATNNCHILFISSSEKKRLTEICMALQNRTVLTVSEVEGFLEAGGMIDFVRQGNKIRFQINDSAAKAAGLRIRAKLLSLAVPSPGQ